MEALFLWFGHSKCAHDALLSPLLITSIFWQRFRNVFLPSLTCAFIYTLPSPSSIFYKLSPTPSIILAPSLVTYWLGRCVRLCVCVCVCVHTVPLWSMRSTWWPDRPPHPLFLRPLPLLAPVSTAQVKTSVERRQHPPWPYSWADSSWQNSSAHNVCQSVTSRASCVHVAEIQIWDERIKCVKLYIPWFLSYFTQANPEISNQSLKGKMQYV